MRMKVLSVLLTAVLCLSLMTMGVLAAGPQPEVSIDGVTMVQGKYLPSHGSSLLQTAPTEGGYAVLEGDVLTLHDFAHEGAIDGEALLESDGSVQLNLEGSSTLLSTGLTVLSVDGTLTVSGSGSLQIYGQNRVVTTKAFVMAGGTVQLSSKAGNGGDGIAANTFTYTGGTLTVQADYGFYNYDDLDGIVAAKVAPAAGETLTFWYSVDGTDTPETVTCTTETDVPLWKTVLDADGDPEERRCGCYWFVEGAGTQPPAMPEQPMDLIVAGVPATETNHADMFGDGTVSFDPDNWVLTLQDARLKTGEDGIWSTGRDLTVVLKGKNTIDCGGTGIIVDFGHVRLEGDGSLEIRAGYDGIFIYSGFLTVDGCKLQVEAEENTGLRVVGGDMFLENCTVNVESEGRAIDSKRENIPDSYGIPGGDLTIRNSQITARSRSDIAIVSQYLTKIHDSAVSAYGEAGIGPLKDFFGNVTEKSGSDGMDAARVELHNSTLTVEGGEDGLWVSGDAEFVDSTVNLSGRQNAVQVKGDLEMKGCKLKAIMQPTNTLPVVSTNIAVYVEKTLTVRDCELYIQNRRGVPAIAVPAGKTIDMDTDPTLKTVTVYNAKEVASEVLTLVDWIGRIVSEVDTRPVTVPVPVVIRNPITAPAPVLEEVTFTDVTQNRWYYEAVMAAASLGLLDGVGDGVFSPETELTVAQTIKLAAALHQLDNLDRVTLQNGDDVWYSTYVRYAIANGIIGEDYGSYTHGQLNAPISREEFVHILHGAMAHYHERNTVADNAIPDVKTDDPYAAEIYTFYRAGILTGSDSQGSFRPDSSIKRAEVAAIVVRMYDDTARQGITL